MRYETFKFIIANKVTFLHDNATAGGSDNTVDPGAATTVNPTQLLAPVIGGSGLIKVLTIVALVLAVLYLLKINLKP